MHHAGAEDFHPAGLLAGRAAGAAADLTLHVHLGGRLGERKERRAEAHLRGRREDTPSECRQRRLEVDECDAFIDCEAFNLLEHRRVRRVERISAVAASRDDDANRRRVALEGADLHGRGVRAQQDVAAQVKAVLRVERRMVFGKVQCVEVVALRLGFRSDYAREAQLAEDVADLVHHLRDEVQPAAPLAPARHGEVDVGQTRRAALELTLARFDGAFELPLQGIRGSADFPACVGVQRGESFENIGESTSLAAQELGFELLETAFVRVRDLFETLPQRF